MYVRYSNLSQTIPIHYNVFGEADRFGEKEEIWKPLIVVTIIFIGMTICSKFPHIFNYPLTITKDNELRQYSNATRLLRHFKLVITLIFGYLILKSLQNSDLDGWFPLVMLGLLIIPFIMYVKNLK